MYVQCTISNPRDHEKAKDIYGDSRSLQFTGRDENEYWELVFRLAARGYLNEVRLLLEVHPEIYDATRSPGIESQHCQQLFETLSEHPTAKRICSDETGGLLFDGSCRHEWNLWRQDLAQVTSVLTNSRFFHKVPKLNELIRLLSKTENRDCRDKDWRLVCLEHLLYDFSPDLSHSNLLDLVSRVVNTGLHGSRPHIELDIMRGDFFDFIYASYITDSKAETIQHSNSETEIKLHDIFACLYQVSIVHITCLLSNSDIDFGDSRESDLQIINDVSLLEDLALMAVRRLFDLQFPLEVGNPGKNQNYFSAFEKNSF